ncbi:hypothetical protein K490DRAFT_41819 [Saccharata proteae CBS 121410]|uniref:Zn(2)-C6 fungal-type domain-containing protein n=1 Tax=Saccharata proteae CBS 121410 TaxID=1314787 RepID=A0A9P4HWT5_9PEZI|nr:hypothetical protein K490DRAFT_41819 [Saccharata proteae CBS 121410]
MPGILPMKVIKVGTSSQARIAQACDRCRSKKIRCDGIRPSCTQCLNVGFECKTSDKLSRRAFPRGYTESLEERVRQLEAEIRELKDLLDEKDEKIDMLSRIHSHSPQPSRRPSSTLSPRPSVAKEDVPDKNDVFKCQQSPLLLEDGTSDSYFVGTSSGRTLIDAFNRRVQETGRPFPVLRPESFFGSETRESQSPSSSQGSVVWKAPPRLLSDQMINIFFQEWAPLFPVLHRPTFLALYEEYVSGSDTIEDKQSLAQLNLVFGIAALSSDSRDEALLESFEAQWQAAIDSFLDENSLATLQCLVLAQIYSLQKADYSRLLKFKGIAISLSQRLGLHQSQKRFALGALTSETRKKVFWTLYTLDCFTAAQLGLPKHFKEEDVHCEYPVDADDEYVTEKGFLPSLPGEFTKLSSALALFRACRILAKVLAESYPASPTHEISLRRMAAHSDELDEWSKKLPSHLKLQFVQDKPSTNVISSRSPIVSMVYHYIRSLIWRPAVCANIGARGASAVVAVAGSSKHLIQILQLLEERSMTFSFCLNKSELLVMSGFGLVFQCIELDPQSKLLKENQRLLGVVCGTLSHSGAYGADPFSQVAECAMSRPQSEPQGTLTTQIDSKPNMQALQDPARASQKHFKALASKFSPSRQHRQSLDATPESRRATLPNLSTNRIGQHSNHSAHSINLVHSEPSACSEPTLSPMSQRSSIPTPSISVRRPSITASSPNLDFLSFGTTQPQPDSLPASAYAMVPSHTAHTHSLKPDLHSPSDWERLLSGLDNGQTNIYDSIYGGQPVDALVDVPPLTTSTDASLAWSPSVWTVGQEHHQPTQSVLSFSDESLTSGGDEFACDFGSGPGSGDGGDGHYRSLVMPAELSAAGQTVGLGGLDGGFGL